MFDAEPLKKAVAENDVDAIKKVLFDMGQAEVYKASHVLNNYNTIKNYNEIESILPEHHKALAIYYLYPLFNNNQLNTILIESQSLPSKDNIASTSDIINAPCTVIHNNEGYLSPGNELPSSNNPYTHKTLNNFTPIQGNSLRLGEIPIGYNVHLPPNGTVKSVFFRVYGGMNYRSPPPFMLFNKTPEQDEQNFRDSNGFHPGCLEEIEKRLLLNQDIAVVTLNLPDLLELKVVQGQMPKELHNKIHACINHAFETIHFHPETLTPELAVLKDKQAVLSGMSFGGRTAAMHAALYPNTFEGYFSINGAISNEMNVKSDLPGLKYDPIREYSPYLDPGREEFLKFIQDPILVLHTRDDTNLNVKIAMDFYNKLKSIGKSDLVNLMIFDKGEHAYIEDPSLLKALEQDLARFVENGASDLTALHEWRALRQDTMANQFYGEASLNEKFISQAHQTGVTRNLRKDPSQLEALWENTFEPLFASIVYSNQIAYNSDYLEKEIDRLKNIINVDHAMHAFKAQQKLFNEFLSKQFAPYEKINMSVPKISEETLDSLNPVDILKLYKQSLDALKAAKPEAAALFLSNLYRANPPLLQAARKAYPDIEYKLGLLAKDAKQSLKDFVQTEKKMILNTWKQTIVKAAEKQKKAIPEDDKSSGKKPKK